MHSSDGVIYNVSCAHSTADLNVKTNNTDPLISLAIKDHSTAKDSSKKHKNIDNNDENGDGDSSSVCAAAYRRFLSDWSSISILLFLYTLQGLPFGLINSIPLIIQEKSASYNQQAKFSIAVWPFCLKLLWAPFVDALYLKKIGRRKSWLISVQYLIGVTLFVLSYEVDHLIDTLQIGVLTAYFFFINFLNATQDIAVDGWALTMLKRENVGLAPTCNVVGHAFGAFIGHAVFLNLASKDFSNNYLRSIPQEEGIVTLSSFMVIWSYIYFVTTTLIFVFKHEGDANHADNENTIVKSYVRLYKISKLPAVRMFILFQLSKSIMILQIGFAAVHGVSDLKLVEFGLAKEMKALLSVPVTPISLFIPVVILKWTAGHKPMTLYGKAFAAGLILSGIIGVMVWVTGTVKDTSTVRGDFPDWYFPLLLLIECGYKICLTITSVSNMAFIVKISDPEHGATCTTLYNTIANIGSIWPVAIALWLVDPLTISKPCNDTTTVCDQPTIKVFDGYYIETMTCILLGFCWLFWGRRTINKLQTKPDSEWRITEKLINVT